MLTEQLLDGELGSYEVEQRVVRKDGGVVFVKLAVSLMPDAGGDLLLYVAQVQDASAQDLPEDAASFVSSHLQAIFEYAPVGLALFGLDGRLLRVNQSAVEILGSALEPAGDGELRFLAEELAIGVERPEIAIEPVSAQLPVSRADGRERLARLVRYPVLDDAGQMTHFGVACVDVSDERQRAIALRDLQSAQRAASVGSWFADPAAGTVRWSTEMYRIFGRDPADGPASAERVFAYVAVEDRERVRSAYASVLAGDGALQIDYRINAGDGIERSVHATASEDSDRAGCFIGTVQDLATRQAATRSLQAAEERFRSMFENAPIGMALSDLDGRYLQVNSILCQITGYTGEQLRATSQHTITHPQDAAADQRLNERLQAGEIERYRREQRYLRPDGTVVWVSQHTSLARDREGKPHQILTQILDISDRRTSETQLLHLADHDPLTGLPNQRALHAELRRHLAPGPRHGLLGALLVLDLDHFKDVNDTLGHNAGDELLISTAALLSRRLCASDTIARLSGDAFAILLPEADQLAAEQVATHIITDIRHSQPLIAGRRPGRVTASIGMTLLKHKPTSAEDALSRADLAKHHAKQAGRDRIALYAPDDQRAPPPPAYREGPK